MDFSNEVKHLQGDVYLIPCRSDGKNWVPIVAPGKQKSRCWTGEEDTTLMLIIEKHGTVDWKKICNLLNKKFHKVGYMVRTPKQVRERWVCHLNPELNKGPWTEDEDNMLLHLVAQYGRSWATISK
jgi:hypothetical protein